MTKIKILVAAIIALAAGFGGVAWRVNQEIKDIESKPITSVFEFEEGQRLLYLLVIGVDDTDGSHRADSIAVAAIDIETNKIKLLSIPRDTRVSIPGHGWQKINHAYAFGGVDLLQQTIRQFLNIKLDYYVVINYDSFPQLVDLVGGIDLVVDKDLKYRDRSQNLNIDIKKGPQHMDGKTSLLYVRFRHDPLGDIGRVQRQQKFLTALLKKVKDPSILPRLPEIATEVLGVITTNLTIPQAAKLAFLVQKMPSGGNGMRFDMLPGSATYISNISYWLADTKDISRYLAPDTDVPDDILPSGESASDDVTEETAQDAPLPGESFDVTETVRKIARPIAVLNGNGKSGVSSAISTRLQELGIDVTYVGNAKHFDYRSTNILFPEKGSEKDKTAARSLAKLCGVTNPKLVRSDAKTTYATLVIGHDFPKLLSRLQESALNTAPRIE